MKKFLKPVPVVDRKTGKPVREVEGRLRDAQAIAAAKEARDAEYQPLPQLGGQWSPTTKRNLGFA